MRRLYLSLTLLVCLFASVATRASAAGNLCCPVDLTGDPMVDGADLAVLLGAWGPAAPGNPADLDGSGTVDGADLAMLLGGWGPCPSPCLKTILSGSAKLADGTPVANAVLLTNLGGQGVSAVGGDFNFEVDLQEASTSLDVSAAVSIGGMTFSGMKSVTPIVQGGVTVAGVITLSEGGPCVGDPAWLPTFGGMPGANGEVWAMATFDDGSGAGPSLIAAGSFDGIGGVAANRIARWDGSTWTALGSGLNGIVTSLIVFDDGSGPALYVGGSFTTAGGSAANRIARWDGVSWSTLGAGFDGGVQCLAVFDDGGGPSLYAAGSFGSSGGVFVKSVARWNGSSWLPLGLGCNGPVYALSVFPGAGGPVLCAGGAFTMAGGSVANRAASWNGTSWTPLGGGMNGTVRTLTAFDDGSGISLYAGGDFALAEGAPANHLAKWNGSNWFQIGSGANGNVWSLAVADDGSGTGPALFAGGDFTTAGSTPASRVAKWSGSAWSPLGDGTNNTVYCLATFDDGRGGGPQACVGGVFSFAGGGVAKRIARWDGAVWRTFGSGADAAIHALLASNDASGPGRLYAGGSFSVAGGVVINRVGAWDGTAWSPLGSGMNSSVQTMVMFDDGSGPALYAAGDFTTADGLPANRVAKWTGSTWVAVGSGLNGSVFALATFDDGTGSGPALYAGGSFTQSGGNPVNRVAKWDGTSWSGVGGGVDGTVYALAIFDDGGGKAMYAGGSFLTAGGGTVNRIAKWNGESWSALGAGLGGSVAALTTFNDGSGGGMALYVGGSFMTAGGASANQVARWNGSTWSPLGSGTNLGVTALTTFDDDSGSGPALYVGGNFTTAGGASINRIARWNGSSWAPLGIGLPLTVKALLATDLGNGTGRSLYVGGAFDVSPAADSYIARWGCDGSANDGAPSVATPVADVKTRERSHSR